MWEGASPDVTQTLVCHASPRLHLSLVINSTIAYYTTDFSQLTGRWQRLSGKAVSTN
jgi:hypothetical protein